MLEWRLLKDQNRERTIITTLYSDSSGGGGGDVNDYVDDDLFTFSLYKISE